MWGDDKTRNDDGELGGYKNRAKTRAKDEANGGVSDT